MGLAHSPGKEPALLVRPRLQRSIQDASYPASLCFCIPCSAPNLMSLQQRMFALIFTHRLCSMPSVIHCAVICTSLLASLALLS